MRALYHILFTGIKLYWNKTTVNGVTYNSVEMRSGAFQSFIFSHLPNVLNLMDILGKLLKSPSYNVCFRLLKGDNFLTFHRCQIDIAERSFIWISAHQFRPMDTSSRV